MTAQILSGDLTTIIHESKKREAHIKTAAERSLQELKSLPSTSETQLAADLRRRPLFVNPFVQSCKSKNVKLLVPAIGCLQRLIVSGGLAPDRLGEVLDAFRDCVGIGLDAQLKILQSLPSLLQRYGDSISGELLATLVQICTSLQQVRTAAVSNTASATLQQAVSFVFETLQNAEESDSEVEVSHGTETIKVKSSTLDAYLLLRDICFLIDGRQPNFIKKATLSQEDGLDLIENIMLNYSEIFDIDHALQSLMKDEVMPLVHRFLSERPKFLQTIRSLRILCILLREHLRTLIPQCEMALGMLNHILETESAGSWRRAACMETIKILYSDAELLVNIHSTFDQDPARKSILHDNMSIFVRLSSEKPALIGLGQRSTIPSLQGTAQAASQEQAVLEAGDAAGMIGGDFAVPEAQVPGISSQWSSPRSPVLDQLDKNDPPVVPETYSYSLVLSCLFALSEAAANIVLPLTMRQHKTARKARNQGGNEDRTDQQHDSEQPDNEIGWNQIARQSRRARMIPINPLEETDSSANGPVKAVATLITESWPAILATSSIFFNASLDSDFYRGLVRAVQKFTQVAGILRLSTARDAMLTALAKAAIPPSLFQQDASPTPTSAVQSPGKGAGSIGAAIESVANLPQPDENPTSYRRSSDDPAVNLTPRNLMCLRALVHLAIALGPILGDAWQIVLECIQKAHVLVATSGSAALAREYRSNTQASNRDESDASAQPTLRTEIAAVEGAVSKLFESSAEYPRSSFEAMLQALCTLLMASVGLSNGPPRKSASGHTRRQPSIAGLVTSSALFPHHSQFAVAKLGEFARINLERLLYDSPAENWGLLTRTTIEVSCSTECDGTTRRMAADIVASVAAKSCEISINQDFDSRRAVQSKALSLLTEELGRLIAGHAKQQMLRNQISFEVHVSILSSLHSILETCGESLCTGWPDVVTLLSSTFENDFYQPTLNSEAGNRKTEPSNKLLRSAFSSIQLICSDFLDAIPSSIPLSIIQLLQKCSSQTLDMNTALSAVSLFSDISEYLQKRIASPFELPPNQMTGTPETLTQELSDLSENGNLLAAWVVLLRTLVVIAEDTRSDIRNVAIHVCFRAIEAPSDSLSPRLRAQCFSWIVLPLLSFDANRQPSDLGPQSSDELNKTVAEFNSTSKVVIEGFLRIASASVDKPKNTSALIQTWSFLLEHFTTYIDLRRSLEVTAIVYSTLEKLILELRNENIPPKLLGETLALWVDHPPRRHPDSKENSTALDTAMFAYVRAITTIFASLPYLCPIQDVENILQRLQDVLGQSRSISYANDVSKPTALQQEVLSFTRHIRSDQSERSSKVLQCLAHFTSLPLAEKTGSNTMTFIALAKEVMAAMQSFVHDHCNEVDLYESDGVSSSLRSLSNTIKQKYTWHLKPKSPDFWQEAEHCASEIIACILNPLKALSLSDRAKISTWTAIDDTVQSVRGGTWTHLPDQHSIVLDETHDLAILSRLRWSVTASMCQDQDSSLGHVRQQHIQSLYLASEIHIYGHDNINLKSLRVADDGQSLSQHPALQNLYESYAGRTQDPPYKQRIRIAYVCFDELFALVSGNALDVCSQVSRHASQSARIGDKQQEDEDGAYVSSPLLTRLALPYLIRRCASPLKRYIADQPLRGRMPTPMSQRLELLYVLDKVSKLQVLDEEQKSDREVARTEPAALYKFLAPLVTEALVHVHGDRELREALSGFLQQAVRRSLP